jgi:5-methylcytosine-specific restriction endonuclease McrA
MNCQTCAADITGHKRRYCGPTCYPSYKPRKELPRQDCQNCGKSLDNPPKAGRPKRNCSVDCRRKIQSKRVVKKPKQNLTCNYCQATFASATKQRFCSKPCRYEASKIESRVKYWEHRKAKYPDGLATADCGWCKKPRTFEYGKESITAFHPKCTIEARRARYRIKTVKRQSLINKPSRLAADDVVRLYGNTCAVCLEPIDLELKRTSKMGLTVDHWIPLSKGGSDDISNLRPAHWICNRRKSNKLPKEVNA